MGWDYSFIGLEKNGDGFDLVRGTCIDAEQGTPQEVVRLQPVTPTRVYSAGLNPNYECDIYLRIKVGKGGVCTFFYSLDGKKFKAAGEPFTARQGKWIGAKVGMFATVPDNTDRGWMDIDWFRLTE